VTGGISITRIIIIKNIITYFACLKWHYVTSLKVAGSISVQVIGFFIDLLLPAAL
jgi:hypothetical protein